MPVNVTLQEDGNSGQALHISLIGRFDISMYTQFGACYKDHLGNVSQIIIDMDELEYLDSSALGMLLMLRERAGGASAKIQLINISPAVGKILSTVKFDKLFSTQMKA